MRFFGKTRKATFLARPNRFALICDIQGKRVNAYLPNPGRLHELLLPGARVYLEESPSKERLTPYTAVAIQRGNLPVMLHTHRTNAVARYLLEQQRIPGLEEAEVVRAEVSHGRSRFDFLLKRGKEKIFLEVKSCTLFSRRVAMFPDAVTTRGKRHVEELLALTRGYRRSACLFMVHNPQVDYFLPEYHTDLEFSKALYRARKKVWIIPLAIEWRKDLSLGKKTRVLPCPWPIVEQEAEDRGSYLLLLTLHKRANLEVGKLGKIRFKPGYYIYVGSAKAHLSKRLMRHSRLRKNKFWHIDYLREACTVLASLPVLTEGDLECEIAKSMKKLADQEIPGFGFSDCSCPSHLFYMKKNPLESPLFHELLQYFRMERLVRMLH